jgi:hypothetical protein
VFTSFVPYFVLWIVLALPVVALIIYRKTVSQQEDDSLKLSPGSADAASQQVGIDHKLEQIDKWGKLLTAIVVGYGVILLAVFLYHSWVAGTNVGVL